MAQPSYHYPSTPRLADELKNAVPRTASHLVGWGKMNRLAVQRLRNIATGQIERTQFDLNFYSHELREFVRYRRLGWPTGQPAGEAGWTMWENAHTATLKDYRLTDFDAAGRRVLYHPDTYAGPRL